MAFRSGNFSRNERERRVKLQLDRAEDSETSGIKINAKFLDVINSNEFNAVFLYLDERSSASLVWIIEAYGEL